MNGSEETRRIDLIERQSMQTRNAAVVRDVARMCRANIYVHWNCNYVSKVKQICYIDETKLNNFQSKN